MTGDGGANFDVYDFNYLLLYTFSNCTSIVSKKSYILWYSLTGNKANSLTIFLWA